MWETIELIVQPIAVYLLMPILVLGWGICMFEPGWELISLWRTSKMPLVKVEPQPNPTLTLAGEAAERRALEDSIYMLLAAEGTAERIGAVAPRGARDFTFILVYAGVFLLGIATLALAMVLNGFGIEEDVITNFNLIGRVIVIIPFAGIPMGLYGMISVIPGLSDADDSLKTSLVARRYYTEGRDILVDAKIKVESDLDFDTPPFVDPAQQIYHSNMGLWAAIAFLPRLLLMGTRIMRLKADITKLTTASRDLRMAAEEALEKLDQPAVAERTRLADRIPMVA